MYGVASLENSNGQVVVTANCAPSDVEIVGTHVLLAVGRIPNTDDLSPDNARVVTDKRGFVTVDNGLRTKVPDIWVIGDANGRGAFMHTSYMYANQPYTVIQHTVLIHPTVTELLPTMLGSLEPLT